MPDPMHAPRQRSRFVVASALTRLALSVVVILPLAVALFVSRPIQAAPTTSAAPAYQPPSPPTVRCAPTRSQRWLSFGGPVADTYGLSGFDCFLPGTPPPAPLPRGVTFGGPGTLRISGAKGRLSGAANTRGDALALRVELPGGYAVSARIQGPFAPIEQQSSGVLLGRDVDNYAQVVIGQRNGRAELRLLIEQDGTPAVLAAQPLDRSAIDADSEALDLWLVRGSDGSIRALYRTITSFTTFPRFGPITALGAATAIPEWSHDAALYAGPSFDTPDPAGDGKSSVAGEPGSTIFDDFAVGPPVQPADAPPPISFTSRTLAQPGTSSGSAFGISGFVNPTTLQLGPDGKLYVGTQKGRIYVLTLDQTRINRTDTLAITNMQLLPQIYEMPTRTCNINGVLDNCQYLEGVAQSNPDGRQVTGLLVAPGSSAGQITLYVSHSDPRIGTNNSSTSLKIDTYSGVISRITLQAQAGSDAYAVTSVQDLLTGLPRSRENHSVNGMDLGPDGWLYLSLPGHTNYGQISTYFSNLPEYYLSAAVARLNLNALDSRTLPIDVSGVRGSADMTPLQNVFELYATGYRNGYDITWHSNGKLYLNDNQGNNGLGNTPDQSDGCPAPAQAINPGTLADHLHLVTHGAYGGHPNPARGECILDDGTYYEPDVTPEPHYTPPLISYSKGGSTNGIVEYTATAFGGQMIGNLISATYAGNHNVRRVVLSPDGTQATQEINLGTFVQPIDVDTDAAGRIYVADYGSDTIVVMLPDEDAICPNSASSDDDGDGYSDDDETLHQTDPCSAASIPPDFDGDRLGDLSDPDDDNDALPDTSDQLFFDANNGASTALPLAFEWNPGDPALGRISETGFAGAQIATNGARLDDSALRVGAAGGFMSIDTGSGTFRDASNSQLNALQIGFDSSAPFRVWSRIVEPFNSVAPAAGHEGGIFFGPDQDNLVSLALTGSSNGRQILRLGREQSGSFSTQASVDLGTSLIADLDLYLIGQPGTRTIRAFYALNGGTPLALGGAIEIPAAWLSDNTGAARNTSLAGLHTSSGGAAAVAYVFDFFRVDRDTVIGQPTPTATPIPATSTPTATPTSLPPTSLPPTATPTSLPPTATPPATPTSGPSSAAFVERDGLVVLEAEQPHQQISRSSQSWVARTNRAGFVGSAALVAEPDQGTKIYTSYLTKSPELRYQIQFSTPGTYYVWLRALPGTEAKSVHVGLDSAATASADNMSTSVATTWKWFQSTSDGPVATLTIASAGTHTVNVWMREDGFVLDRLLLTADRAFVPSGTGPAASPRAP